LSTEVPQRAASCLKPLCCSKRNTAEWGWACACTHLLDAACSQVRQKTIPHLSGWTAVSGLGKATNV